MFEEVVRAARRQGREAVRWSAYGGGDTEILRRLRRLGVAVHGYYRAGSLPALLRRDAVDVALLLSIWPETYTLVVDECLMAGVPVVAFDLGAPAERLRGATACSFRRRRGRGAAAGRWRARGWPGRRPRAHGRAAEATQALYATAWPPAAGRADAIRARPDEIFSVSRCVKTEIATAASKDLSANGSTSFAGEVQAQRE